MVRRSKGNIEAIEEYIQREQRQTIRPDGPSRREAEQHPSSGEKCSGRLLRLVRAQIPELVLGRLLTLINLRDVLAFGLLVDHVPRSFDGGVDHACPLSASFALSKMPIA